MRKEPMNPANNMVSPANSMSTASRPLLMIGASRPPSPGGPSPNRGRLTGTRRMGIAAVDCAILVQSQNTDYRNRHQQQNDCEQNAADLAIALLCATASLCVGRIYLSHESSHQRNQPILSRTITSNSAG